MRAVELQMEVGVLIKSCIEKCFGIRVISVWMGGCYLKASHLGRELESAAFGVGQMYVLSVCKQARPAEAKFLTNINFYHIA